VAHDLRSDGYTHVLVLVMGWNTAQDEAIRNFNDMVGNLVEAAKEGPGSPQTAFRPLLIGISWPSYWYHSLINGFSYLNKANDADELGISWINLLVNRELPRAMEKAHVKVPVVMIGHSFGARVVTRVAGASPRAKSPERRRPCGSVLGGEPYRGLGGCGEHQPLLEWTGKTCERRGSTFARF